MTATFDGSVFKPDTPVTLPDRARVRILVQPLDEEGMDTDEAMDELDTLWDEVSVDSDGVRLTRDQLHGRI